MFRHLLIVKTASNHHCITSLPEGSAVFENFTVSMSSISRTQAPHSLSLSRAGQAEATPPEPVSV